MPSIYLDSSVLIPYLYKRSELIERIQSAESLIEMIRAGPVSAVISFYALPELYSFVKQHQPQEEINPVLRLSLIDLFSLPLVINPFLDRAEFEELRKQISISDPDDARHVASALSGKCDAIITFDHHFKQVANLISVYTPDEFLATIESAP